MFFVMNCLVLIIVVLLQSGEFHTQVSDVNHEPGCKGTFGCTFTNKQSRVFKIGEENKGLTIDFNPAKKTAEIEGKNPVKFHYFIQVKPAQDPFTWIYAGGKDNAKTIPITGKLDNIVEEALFAMLGVES